MREIEFRAWNKTLKKMFKVGQITLEKGIWTYVPDNKEHIGVCVPYQPSFILMQYTGLKDKNGKKIYEGDIVKAFYFEKEVIGKIEFIYGTFALTDSAISDNQLFIFENLEVLGNIYDNPELLKENIS